MISVFVYGTLLVGEANHGIVAPFLRQVAAGAVRGRLYDAGAYPAVVLGGEEQEIVRGEWLAVTGEGLTAMDALEEYEGPGGDNDYERVWVSDAFDDSRQGWIYVWLDPRGCSRIPGGSWKSCVKGRNSGRG
ncbi:gamma-glutamylcyclotransferase family protein [Paenibacillus piri]|uniref:Gamma-glutamylcyclotransferase n=1 Tax=Paenibacillus piri TaxID=2547395 RepID=A0A4R5KX46_9BACL|nr:gamma-glutamylcyclotransferase family protein [Paenibacillus piri]TDG00397.1 gamma-glutamylcyclotransferase [Paenibacillus piri]